LPRRTQKTIENITSHLVASLDCLERAFSSWLLQDYVRHHSADFQEITSEHESYFTVNHIVWQSTHSCALSLAKIFDESSNVKSLAKLCRPKLSCNSQFVNYAAKQIHGYCDYCDRRNRTEYAAIQTGAQMLPDRIYEECPRLKAQCVNIKKFVQCWESKVAEMLESDELKRLSKYRSTHIAHSGSLANVSLPYAELHLLLGKCAGIVADGLFLLGRDVREQVADRKAISEKSAAGFWTVFLKGLS